MMEQNTSPDQSQQKKSEDLMASIYETRLLVFMEGEPQSNMYHQLLFTADEFQKVSFSIGMIVRGKDINGITLVRLRESKEQYKLPDLKTIYEPKENAKKNIG